MKRRNFVRLAGGGAVAAVAGLSFTAWTLSAAVPPQALQAWQGPGPETDPRRRAVAYAITAPNPHNLQPWLVDLREPGAIVLHCDRERLLAHTDPFGRQILIGHGAFLELLVQALAQQRIASKVTPWPQGELPGQLKDWDARPVARVELVPGAAAPDPLFAQVLRRHTPKVDFDPAQPVTAQTLDQLLARAGSAGVRAGGSVDAARVQPLRELCLAAAKIELSTGRTALESQRLTRVGPDEILRHRDGISINTPAARIATSLGLFDRSVAPAAGSMAMEQMVGRYVGHTASAMGFAWLATPGNSRGSQLEAGRAYVRLQLKATGLGVGMHPMSQALQEFGEMTGPYRKVHQLLAQQGETVQMLCRLGYPAAPVEPAPRRPVASLFYGS